jgi:hypothetical protein
LWIQQPEASAVGAYLMRYQSTANTFARTDHPPLLPVGPHQREAAYNPTASIAEC